MLQLRSISKHFGSKTLFENATAFLDAGARTALIGPNGAGKSTLIKLILGVEHPDQGEITLHPHVRVGHLAQELPKFENRTVFEEVMSLDGRREEILVLKASIESELSTASADSTEKLLKEYARVLEELDGFDEYKLPSRAEQILEGVGFRTLDFHRPLSDFSGGWLMRVALARVLLLQPDLLILDEPTNHLDLESLLWLEAFLKQYPGALLMVSHDRAFLNPLVNQVWEIDQQSLQVYSGNLDSFVAQKEERLLRLQAEAAGQQAKMSELKQFIERFGAKASKARQAQSRQKQLERLEAQQIELPEDRAQVRFRFPPTPPSGREVITLKGAGFTYPASPAHPVPKTIFKKLDWILLRGSRVAIVGSNGAGKTTLLKCLAQTLPLTEGVFRLGHQVQLGYYSQLQAETLDLKHTILQELEAIAPKLEISEVRAIAGAFLFTGDDVHKKIGVLSGGEKARVALAKLLLTPTNVLLLDEPTNHLDADSREVLLRALLDYTGTIILVSHDRDFVAPLADQLLEVRGDSAETGQVTPLVWTYEEYLQKKVQETQERIQTKKKSTAPAAVTPEKKYRPSHNQLKNWEKELKTVERSIADAEKRQSEINDALATQNFDGRATELQALIAEQTELQSKIDRSLSRWEELSIELSKWAP